MPPQIKFYTVTHQEEKKKKNSRVMGQTYKFLITYLLKN